MSAHFAFWNLGLCSYSGLKKNAFLTPQISVKVPHISDMNGSMMDIKLYHPGN